MTPFIEPSLWRKDPVALEAMLREALRRLPEQAPMREQIEVFLVTAIMEQHRFTEARTSLDSVLQRFPENREARFCDAELAFHMDEPWPSPWIKFESRWALEMSGPWLDLPGELWDGGDLHGRRILLAGEGGLGDEIQFSRFAPVLKAAGARSVLVSSAPSLIPLLKTIPGVDDCRPRFAPQDYDVWVPMLTVPGLLRITTGSVPDAVPYLFPPFDPEKAGPGIGEGQGFRIGLCWHSRNPIKTLPLELFRDLMQIPGIRAFAFGEKIELDKELPGFPLTNLGARIPETAASLRAMDLIITVDTMTAHLAGALGLPVLLLLHYLPCGRWGARGAMTPWYPTMRLIRQQSDRRWDSVIQRIGGLLNRWVASEIPDFLSFWPSGELAPS
jgi:hypothetical protein